MWSEEWDRYVRRFRVVYIVMGRKNGKSAIASAFVLYLLIGDDEESSEVYGAAVDTKQAAKVYGPAQRMMTLSPVLSKRLKENKAARKIKDITNDACYYEIIAGDALGELGHNPHGFVMDEVLSQPNRDLWDALRTAAGARAQAMFLAITTETNDDSSFGARMIDEAEGYQTHPESAPHILSWVRKTPMHADPWDESNWAQANPALGTFKSITEMRTQASEAKKDPEKENSFRQFQLNQRVQQVTRWMPMIRWDANKGILSEDDLIGRSCFGGLDLASTIDMSSLVWMFPNDDGYTYDVLVRAWLPEDKVPELDKATGGRLSVWVRKGFLIATGGDWIDYYGNESEGGLSINAIQTAPNGLAIHPQIAHDVKKFDVMAVGYDQAQATATAQFMQGLDVQIKPIVQGYGLSKSLKEIMRRVKAERFRGLENPIIRWAADASEVKRNSQEGIMVVRPDRGASKKRIDALVALADAVAMEQNYEPEIEETNPFETVF